MLELLKKPARFTLNKALQLKTKLAIRHLKDKSIILLEIGAGNKKGTNGWTTLDTVRGADLQWDLRNGIPFPDSSIDKIYTSHTFEHIPFPSLQILIRECWRKLKPLGSLSVCVPNARFYIDAYLKGKPFRDQSTLWQPGICETGSAIDQLNYIAYMGGEHRYMFDEENLIRILRQNGFEQAELRSFDSTIDAPERDRDSIYAVGIK